MGRNNFLRVIKYEMVAIKAAPSSIACLHLAGCTATTISLDGKLNSAVDRVNLVFAPPFFTGIPL
jgi:hypothetical protein